MYRLLVLINKTPASIWQGFKELCKAYNLPYHTLKSQPFPRQCNEYEILRVPWRCSDQETELKKSPLDEFTIKVSDLVKDYNVSQNFEVTKIKIKPKKGISKNGIGKIEVYIKD